MYWWAIFVGFFLLLCQHYKQVSRLGVQPGASLSRFAAPGFVFPPPKNHQERPKLLALGTSAPGPTSPLVGN